MSAQLCVNCRNWCTRGFMADFRAFIFQDEVVNLAVGLIIGLAFVEVINSFVTDVITPIFALIGGGGNMDQLFVVLRHAKNANTSSYLTVEEAQAAGAITWNLGRFMNEAINFCALSFFVFLLMKLVDKVYGKPTAVVGGATLDTQVIGNPESGEDADVSAMKRRRQRRHHHHGIHEARLPCPKCAELIKPAAVRCPFCHTEPITRDNHDQVNIDNSDKNDNVDSHTSAPPRVSSNKSVQPSNSQPKKQRATSTKYVVYG